MSASTDHLLANRTRFGWTVDAATQTRRERLRDALSIDDYGNDHTRGDHRIWTGEDPDDWEYSQAFEDYVDAVLDADDAHLVAAVRRYVLTLLAVLRTLFAAVAGQTVTQAREAACEPLEPTDPVLTLTAPGAPQTPAHATPNRVVSGGMTGSLYA